MSFSTNSERVAFWRKLLARRQTSRLTVREVCAQVGVSPASFYAWQQRLRTAERAADQVAPLPNPPALVPVRVIEDRTAPITVELPRAVRVQLAPDSDAATLERVLRAALAACREVASC